MSDSDPTAPQPIPAGSTPPPSPAPAASRRSRMGNRLRGRRDLEPLWRGVYDYLASQILAGELRAGDRVSELRLAAETGVSRSPVREAIGVMRSEGVLEQIPGHGARVREASEQELRDAFDVRRALEAEAAATLARRGASGADMARVRSVCDRIAALLEKVQGADDRVLDPETTTAIVEADAEFHDVLLAASGNARVRKIVLDTRMMIHASRRRVVGLTSGEAVEMFAAHDVIIRAISSHEPERARELMLEHIAWSERRVLRDLKDAEREDALGRARLR